MTLLEKAIKGEEKKMMNGTLTIQPRYITSIEPSKDGKDIYVFNMLLKGHDDKHTLQLELGYASKKHYSAFVVMDKFTDEVRQIDHGSKVTEDLSPKIIVEMKDLNAHLMSDFIKIRIGFVR